LAVPGVTGFAFTRLLAIAFSEVLPGDLDSDPRPWMGKIRDGAWDHRA
jgi:hypothetical protein